MILFTSGFPYAGKSTLVQKLVEELDGKHVLHINPKDYYPDEFDNLTNEEQTEIATTAWEMSLETATKSICALPNKALIIFDTCCNKSLHMRPLFMNAKLRGHRVYLVYVHADLKNRSKRTDKDLSKFEDKYRTNFLETLPILKEHADTFVTFSNNNDDEFGPGVSWLDKVAKDLAGKIKSIRSR